MAGRKPKTGIDYSSWDVDVFHDRKIEDLIDAKGPSGFAVFFAVCQEAYAATGYYLQWEPRDASGIKHLLRDGVDAQTVVDVVDFCLDVGLFDSKIYMQYGVLTSQAMQIRYTYVLAKRRRKEVVADWWLLRPDESGGAELKPMIS